MNLLIISGGEKIKKEILYEYYKKVNYVICVDKGLEYAYEYNIKPNLIMGDMDSVDKDILQKYNRENIITFSKIKDYTDTELAIQKAIKLGAENIFLLCVTGNRLDHTISNIKLLLQLKKHNIKGIIVDNNNKIMIVNKYIKIKKQLNQVISLIPLDQCNNVTTKGLLYPLINKNIDINWNIGISNKIIAEYGEITIKKGNLLIVISKESN